MKDFSMKQSLLPRCLFPFLGLFLLAVAHTTPQGEKQAHQPAPVTDESTQKSTQSDTGTHASLAPELHDFDLLENPNEPFVDPIVETLDHPVDIFIYSLSAFIKKNRNAAFNPTTQVALARAYRANIEEIVSNPVYQNDSDIQGLKKEFEATWSSAQKTVEEDQEPRRSFFDFSPPSLNEKNILKLKDRFALTEKKLKKIKNRLATIVFKDPHGQSKVRDLKRLTENMENSALIGQRLANELYKPFLRSKQIVWGAGTAATTVIGSFLLYHMLKKEPRPAPLTGDGFIISEQRYVHPLIPLLRDIDQSARSCYSLPLLKLLGDKPSAETCERFKKIAHIYAHSSEIPIDKTLLTGLFQKDYQRNLARPATLYKGGTAIINEHGQPALKEGTTELQYPEIIIPYYDRVLSTGRPLCYDDSCQNYRIGDISQDQVKRFKALHEYYINDYIFDCIASELACGGVLVTTLKELKEKASKEKKPNQVLHDGIKNIFISKEKNTSTYHLLSPSEREKFFSILKINFDEDPDNKNKKINIHERVKTALSEEKNAIAWAEAYLNSYVEQQQYYDQLKSLRDSFDTDADLATVLRKSFDTKATEADKTASYSKKYSNKYRQELVWWAKLHTMQKKEVQLLLEKNPYHDTAQNVQETLKLKTPCNQNDRAESRKALAITHTLFFKDPIACEKVTGQLKHIEQAVSAQDKVKAIQKLRITLEAPKKNSSRFIQNAKKSNKQVKNYLKNYKSSVLRFVQGVIQEKRRNALAQELNEVVTKASWKVHEIEDILAKPDNEEQAQVFVALGFNTELLAWAEETVKKGNAGIKLRDKLTTALKKNSLSKKVWHIIEAMLLSWTQEAVLEWEKEEVAKNRHYSSLCEKLKKALSNNDDIQPLIKILNENFSHIKPGIPGEKKLLYVKAYAQKLIDHGQRKISDLELMCQKLHKAFPPDREMGPGDKATAYKDTATNIINILGEHTVPSWLYKGTNKKTIKKILEYCKNTAKTPEERIKKAEELYTMLDLYRCAWSHHLQEISSGVKENRLFTEETLKKLIERFHFTSEDQPLKELIMWAQIKVKQLSNFDGTYKKLSEPQTQAKAQFKVASFDHLYQQEKAALIKKIINLRGTEQAKEKIKESLSDEDLIAWAEGVENTDDIALGFGTLYTKYKAAFLKKIIEEYGTPTAQQAVEKVEDLTTWVETDPNAEAHKNEIRIHGSLYKEARKAWKHSYTASMKKAAHESLEVEE